MSLHWKWKIKVKSLSHVWLFAIPWTVAHQAPTSMGFSRQEYWSGLPFPSPGDLPKPGIEPRSPTLQADALTSEPPGKPIVTTRGEASYYHFLLSDQKLWKRTGWWGAVWVMGVREAWRQKEEQGWNCYNSRALPYRVIARHTLLFPPL